MIALIIRWSLSLFVAAAYFVAFDVDAQELAPEPRLIERLPIRITEAGVYRLARDLDYKKGVGQAVSVEADGVTIDLAGHSLSGSAGSMSLARGIYSNNRSRVTITNGEIRGFYFAIDIRNDSPREKPLSHDHVVSKVRFRRNWYFGVRVMGIRCEIRDCEIIDTGGSTRERHTIPHAARMVGAENAMRDCRIRNMRLKRFASGKGEIVGVHFDDAKDAVFERNHLVELVDKNDSVFAATDKTERRFGLWINGGPDNSTTLSVRDNLFQGFAVPIVFSPGADGNATGNRFIDASSNPIRGKPSGRIAKNQSQNSAQ